jgi:putative ABC transport system permease protein
MEIRPILSALIRNRTGALLVALQIAITLAVLCNAAFIVQQRVAKMERPSGYDEDNLVTLQVVNLDQRDKEAGLASIAADLRALRGLPGVIAASATASLPLSNSGFGWAFQRTAQPDDPDAASAALVLADEHTLATFGVELAAGRWFRPEEIVPVKDFAEFGTASPASVVVTRALAEKLFPDGNALGSTIFDSASQKPATVVGIVERAQGYFVNSPGVERTAFTPIVLASGEALYYVVRTRPGERAAVQREVEGALLKVDPRRILRDVQSFGEIRAVAYRNDRAMTITLLAVIVLLVAVTVLGVFGLMSFNVNRRRKQIGTRRALGARRVDVVRHFLLESWIITTAGAAVGLVLAVGLSVWLVNTFELPKLDWRYLPVGVVALWVVGQLAAYGPARRASGIEPATATRSV